MVVRLLYLGVFRAAGPIDTVAVIGFDVYDVATAPPAKRVHVAAEAIGGPVGDWVGSKAGGFVADLFG